MNIISVINTRDRRHGENQWFWAAWIGVDQTPDLTPAARRANRPYQVWNKIDPTASGFCQSRTEARHASWGAIKSLSPKRPRAHERSWAYDILRKQQANDKRPLFSRCKVGKDKWLWIVYESFSSLREDKDPIAHGVEVTAKLAREQAETAVGPVAETYNAIAENFRTKQAAIKRSQRTTTTSSAMALEFAWRCYGYWGDMDHSFKDCITAHRIVKKTKKQIHVEHEPVREDQQTSGDWRDFVVHTFILDRSEFEATGKAKRRGRWGRGDVYYADPTIFRTESRSTTCRPECFVGLEVPAGASTHEVQVAYRRLAKKTHPDSGGKASQFKQIHDWYEQAMRLAR